MLSVDLFVALLESAFSANSSHNVDFNLVDCIFAILLRCKVIFMNVNHASSRLLVLHERTFLLLIIQCPRRYIELRIFVSHRHSLGKVMFTIDVRHVYSDITCRIKTLQDLGHLPVKHLRVAHLHLLALLLELRRLKTLKLHDLLILELFLPLFLRHHAMDLCRGNTV